MSMDSPRARTTDPQTSHAAGNSFDVTKMELIVLASIVDGGLFGKTWMEQEQTCGLPRQTISPRWRPLVKKGWIESLTNRQGKRITRPGWSNRQQTVWFATPAGAAVIKLKQIGLLRV
jgi:hypothetical protein